GALQAVHRRWRIAQPRRDREPYRPGPLNAPATTASYTLSLHDALPIWGRGRRVRDLVGEDPLPRRRRDADRRRVDAVLAAQVARSEEHTSELQSRENLVCRLLLEKKKSETIKPLHRINQPLTLSHQRRH